MTRFSIGELSITADSQILSGAPVFRGTRVPVEALLENLEAGLSLDQFLDESPTVTRNQAVEVLTFFRKALRQLGTEP